MNWIYIFTISTLILGDLLSFTYGSYSCKGIRWKAVTTMINTNFTTRIIWRQVTKNVGLCGQKCFSDKKCLSYGYNFETNICQGHDHSDLSTHTKTTNSKKTTGVKYFISEEKTTPSLCTSVPVTEPTTAKADTSDRDCLDIYLRKNSNANNGIYKITSKLHSSFDVYCDMTNGGWTVIQRRISDSVNFTRGWNDYVSGFGELSNNFWLGLDYIHALTNPAVDIFFDVITEDTNERAISMYSNFTVEDQNNNFMMRVNVTGTYNAVALQNNYTYFGGFGYHNNGCFTTFDHTDSNNCAQRWGYGGWWYKTCWVVLLNNQFSKMNMASNYKSGVVKRSEIKVKRSLN